VGRHGGAVAQLGERSVRNAEVGSSILLGSTNFFETVVPEVRRKARDRQIALPV
jgi:hypothetical protein